MISTQQVQLIQAAHAGGLLDRQIAEAANVSVATVKRVRVRLGLVRNCVTAQRGHAGEELVAGMATARGLSVAWRQQNGARFNLVIAGRRVDVKTAMQMPDGSWRFRLHPVRQSFFSTHQYAKNYALDWDVLALVCQRADGAHASVYFLPSHICPVPIRLRYGVEPEAGLESWDAVFGPGQVGLAA